jgi:hypothetical protein
MACTTNQALRAQGPPLTLGRGEALAHCTSPPTTTEPLPDLYVLHPCPRNVLWRVTFEGEVK